MWIEEFETVLLGSKATPDTAPFYISKIGIPIQWGSSQVKQQYDSASKDAKEAMERASFNTAMGSVFGNALSKIEVSPSWNSKKLTLRDEKEIPDFRFSIQVKDATTSDPKAVLFALDWKDKTIKRKLPDITEVEAIYLWHLQKKPSSDQFQQLSMFRAEYGYYLDFRYYVLRMPGQKIKSTRKLDGSIDLDALGLEEPGAWVQWKIKEERAEELRGILGKKYFSRT